MKKPKTISDIIKPDLYTSLCPEDKFRFLMLYVQQNKQTNHTQHEAVLKMTEEEFRRREEEND